MSLITDMRLQKAIYWKRLSPDRFGNYTFETPVEIDCRWVDKMTEFRDQDGQVKGATSKVYVDRVMSVGDRLKEGEMPSDVDSDPLSDELSFEIKVFEKNPDFSNEEVLYTAYLGNG